jgi:hypothetical protein
LVFVEAEMVISGLKTWVMKEELEVQEGYEMEREEFEDLMR